MARFSDIPLDLLPLILDYLSKKEFNSLLRVCKPLHQEIIPHLYHEITFKAENSRWCARRLAFLLRTLLERPYLASYVTTFRLLGTHPCWTKYNPWQEETNTSTVNLWGLEGCTALSKAQMIFASNRFYQFVDEEMHKSLPQLRGRSKDALAILVLTRFTELTTLELGDGFLMYSLFIPQILKRAGHLLPKLSHVILGDRKLDTENSVSYMDLNLIRPIFYLPNVKTFEWTMSEPWQFRWNQPAAPRNESLTKLHLFRSNISRTTLAQLLAATPNLRSLHYDYELLFNIHVPWRPIASPVLQLDNLNSVLNGVLNTLEEVEISLGLAPGSASQKEIFEQGLSFPVIQGTMTVLKDMANLRRVEVPMIMILGWFPNFAARLEEVLPSGIQELTLRDDFVKYCPWAVGLNCNKKIRIIGEYIKDRNVHAPKLKTFKIKLVSSRNNDWLYEAVVELRAAIGGEGISSYRFLKEDEMEMACWHFGEMTEPD
ncbi:uncharacterized protein BDR25DRAFT_107674 [Lindgomyces ingoldianus]|uniref:Uncharacterized protein n=1 Tax=Lindgomyces ingoldianus TaxID=673940 RepID=A0ACB6QAZ0_9PLEO|nr:uncharacterized protein BDR25DRAFT_107674 [Lindgomyces ingoldianus]KAF2463660.1 hypothetical protein BDR25DRAFT_107674 [Lindgomyces ingoldianus]